MLEGVLETKFSKYSHGFRPSRGCHSALAQIRKWKGVSWVLEGDIKSFFDNIDHNIIAELLQRHFKDQRLLNLYWKAVKAGYIEWDNGKKKFIEPLAGVPQGGIISPLLSNLILHEFDVHMEKLILNREGLNKDVKKELPNPYYRQLTRKLMKLKSELSSNGYDNFKDLRKKIRKVIRERAKFRSFKFNPLWIKLEYVRYADDWLVGVWGPLSYVRKLKHDLKVFLLSLKLELSEEKTLITNIKKETAKFLGVLIGTNYSWNSSRFQNVRGIKKRIGLVNIIMNAPIKLLLQRLVDKGFIRHNKMILRPTSMQSFTPYLR